MLYPSCAIAYGEYPLLGFVEFVRTPLIAIAVVGIVVNVVLAVSSEDLDELWDQFKRLPLSKKILPLLPFVAT